MDLREASLGFYRVWYAALGHRHGLLARLARRAWTDAELARDARLDPDATAAWLRGAHALGLLERAGARHRLRREHARTLGDEADAETLVHHFRYLAQKSLTFHALDGLMRDGTRLADDMARTYAVATSWDHLAFFARVLPREPEARAAFERGRVLDLGAGLGAWSLAAAQRFPRARIAATDLAMPPLRRALRGSRVEALAPARVPSGAFDLVFLGEVLAAAPDPVALLAAAREASRPGGLVLAMEGLRPADGAVPRGWGDRLVLAMDLDFRLDGSRFLTRDEALDAMRRAGLVRRRVRHLGGGMHVLAARAPMR